MKEGGHPTCETLGEGEKLTSDGNFTPLLILFSKMQKNITNGGYLMNNTFSFLEKATKANYANLEAQISEIQAKSKIDHIFICLKSKNGVAFCESSKKWFYFSKENEVVSFCYHDIIGCSSLTNSTNELSITVSKKNTPFRSNTIFDNIISLKKFADNNAWNFLVKYVNQIEDQTSQNAEEEYRKVLADFKIPEKCTKATILFNQTDSFKKQYAYIFTLLNYNSVKGVQYYVWTENNTLNLFPCWNNSFQFCECQNSYVLTSIPLENIVYFITQGNFYNETRVSGGGGGGTSIKGAIIGGVLAGEVGAVIGSRKPTDPIKTTNILHDDRVSVLAFDSPAGECSINFAFEAYNILDAMISSQKVQTANVQDNKSITEQLKELKSLLDAQLITEDDYNKKKTRILNL